jgi:hypothetical protein
MAFPIEDGSSKRLEHPLSSNFRSLVAFPIEKGNSTRLEHPLRFNTSRLVALERSGSSFRFLEENKSIRLRFLRGCTKKNEENFVSMLFAK